MKPLALIVGLVIVFVSLAAAQDGREQQNFAIAQPLYFVGATSSAPSLAAPLSAPADPPALHLLLPAGYPAAPQEVQGVFPSSNWQAYAGYAYARFYAFPGTTVNRNGFDLSLTYFFKNWLAGEGDFLATFGSLSGQTSDFIVGAGGIKLRWSTSNRIDVWAHGLVGGANFTPQTPYGKQGALAYELGAGLDIPSRHRRLAYRVEADMVGTHFFSAYQYSPKISVGIVYRF